MGNAYSPHDDWWLCEFSLADESRHLMVLQGGKSKAMIENALWRKMEAHNALYPHMGMKLLTLDHLESEAQVRAAKDRIRNANPRQLFADEMYPDNPNALLFQPLNNNDAAGHGEEALLKFLCDGNWS